MLLGASWAALGIALAAGVGGWALAIYRFPSSFMLPRLALPLLVLVVQRWGVYPLAALAVGSLLVEWDALDHDFLEQYATGFEEYAAHVADLDWDKVEASTGDDLPPGMTESKMEAAMTEMEREFSNVDENDPKAMARMMRRMGELTGEVIESVLTE